MMRRRLISPVHHQLDVCGTRAEVGGAKTLGDGPQPPGVRTDRLPIVENDRRARHQSTDQQIEHRPAGGGVIELDRTPAQIVMQTAGFEKLQQYPTVSVHDAFRQAGGCGSEQDP